MIQWFFDKGICIQRKYVYERSCERYLWGNV
jgi:hypothetical protein